MSHVREIHYMSNTGMPCSSKAIDSMVKALNKFKAKIENKMSKTVRKHGQISLDLSKNADQKKFLVNIANVYPPPTRLNMEYLEKFKEKYPEVDMVYNFIKISKALADLKEYKSYVSDDGRIRADISHISLTGRLSMTDPPMQMVQNNFKLTLHSQPIALRNIFRASRGSVFVAGDYGQLELRILASLSKEAKLIKAFNNEKSDPFITIGCEWLNKTEISDDERKRVKQIIYGIIYGTISGHYCIFVPKF